MKRLLFLSSLILMSICLFAQIDVKQEMPLTYDNIAKKAAKEWPGDYTMQKYVIDQQCKSLNEFFDLRKATTIPKDVLNEIMSNALTEWCEKDWVNCTNTILTKNPNKTLETTKREMDAVQACWSADWTMIVYVMEQQIEAYNSLK